MSIKITIPTVPVSVNLMYRTYRGRPILSKRGRQYKKDTKLYIEDCNIEPMTGNLSLTVEMYFKDKRKRDVDNHLKSLIDSLEGVLFENDTQIYEIIARKHIGCKANQTVIELSEFSVVDCVD